MATVCKSIGGPVSQGRPFRYLSVPFQRRLAAAIDQIVQACASVGFNRTECQRGEATGSEDCAGAEGQGGRLLCWEQLGPVAYYPDGVTSLKARARIDGDFAGLDKLVDIRIDIAVAGVGVVKVLDTGRELEEPFGQCPAGDCSDAGVRGRMACEITGSLQIDSDLFDYWNARATVEVVSALLGLFGVPGRTGSFQAIRDLVADPGGQGFFEVRLHGAEPGRGPVYDLGDFELKPP
jgi:hypothetical protein